MGWAGWRWSACWEGWAASARGVGAGAGGGAGAGRLLCRRSVASTAALLPCTCLPPTLLCQPSQVLECAHKYKALKKSQVLSAVKGDEQYKVRRARSNDWVLRNSPSLASDKTHTLCPRLVTPALLDTFADTAPPPPPLPPLDLPQKGDTAVDESYVSSFGEHCACCACWELACFAGCVPWAFLLHRAHFDVPPSPLHPPTQHAL